MELPLLSRWVWWVRQSKDSSCQELLETQGLVYPLQEQWRGPLFGTPLDYDTRGPKESVFPVLWAQLVTQVPMLSDC